MNESQRIMAEHAANDFHGKVLRYVFARIASRQDAEDVASTIMYKVVTRIEQVDESRAALSTWIYAVSHNAVIDYYRARARHSNCSELDENMPDTQMSVEEATLHSEQLELLAAALEQLPERDRDIIILRYYMGLELTDIAERMNLSYGNLRVIISRTLKKLRGLIEVRQ